MNKKTSSINKPKEGELLPKEDNNHITQQHKTVSRLENRPQEDKHR